jgi:hypothetical protein
MKMRTLWVGLFNDKVGLEILNQGRLLYPMNMSFHGMCCRYESWKNVYMWLLKSFRVQHIISTSLQNVFEMHKHNGYKTQNKNYKLMWKNVY